MYGKGLMGSHASLISVEERWQVVQYVRTLMNGEMPSFEEAEQGETLEVEEVEVAMEDMAAANQ